VTRENFKQLPKQYLMVFAIKINLFCVIWREIETKSIVKVIFNGSLQQMQSSLNFWHNFKILVKIQKSVCPPYSILSYTWGNRFILLITSFNKQSYTTKWISNAKEIYITNSKRDKGSAALLELVVIYHKVQIYLFNSKDRKVHYYPISILNQIVLKL
jgi:hypothetical protein